MKQLEIERKIVELDARVKALENISPSRAAELDKKIMDAISEVPKEATTQQPPTKRIFSKRGKSK